MGGGRVCSPYPEPHGCSRPSFRPVRLAEVRCRPMPVQQSLPVPQHRSNVYGTPGTGFLFVPLPSMWTLHELSDPKAILARLGLRADLWRSWHRAYEARYPWLFDWLYRYPDPPPDEARQAGF